MVNPMTGWILILAAVLMVACAYRFVTVGMDRSSPVGGLRRSHERRGAGARTKQAIGARPIGRGQQSVAENQKSG
jgi:hypothetical protein